MTSPFDQSRGVKVGGLLVMCVSKQRRESCRQGYVISFDMYQWKNPWVFRSDRLNHHNDRWYLCEFQWNAMIPLPRFVSVDRRTSNATWGFHHGSTYACRSRQTQPKTRNKGRQSPCLSLPHHKTDPAEFLLHLITQTEVVLFLRFFLWPHDFPPERDRKQARLFPVDKL